MRISLPSFVLAALVGTVLAGGVSVSKPANADPQPSTVPETTAPVQLLEATLFRTNSSNAWVQGTVRVKNVAYEKTVRVVYQEAAWNAPDRPYWTSVDASYVGPLSDGWELWAFWFGGGTRLFNAPIRFAVSYDVAGSEFWDNACGRDYELRLGLGSLEPLARVRGVTCGR